MINNRHQILSRETSDHSHSHWKEVRLVFVEKPTGYSSEIARLQSLTPSALLKKNPSATEVAAEKNKWRLASLAAGAWFKANNITDSEQLEAKFNLYDYLSWKRNYLHREHGVAEPDTLTAGEKELLRTIYKSGRDRTTGKPIDERDMLRAKIRKTRGLIDKKRREIDRMAPEPTPANTARKNKLVAELSAHNEEVTQDESKLSSLNAQLETYRYYIWRHHLVKESSKNLFQEKRETVMQGSVDEYIAKAYDHFSDNWAGMTGGQKFMAFAGITGLLMMVSQSKSEDVKKIWSWVKTMGVGVLFYKLSSEGLSPLLSGKNIPENLSKWRGKILKKSALSQAFRLKGEKAEHFVNRSEKFMKAFVLLRTLKTPTSTLVKAYYEAKDKSYHGGEDKKNQTGRDRGSVHIEGITPGHMSGNDLYQALKMFIAKYPARDRSGAYRPALNDPYYRKLPFYRHFILTLARDQEIDLTKDPISKAFSALSKAAVGGASYLAKKGKAAIENLPETARNIVSNPAFANYIFPGLGDAIEVTKWVLKLPFSTIVSFFQGTNYTTQQIQEFFNEWRRTGNLWSATRNLPYSVAQKITDHIARQSFQDLSGSFQVHPTESQLKSNFDHNYATPSGALKNTLNQFLQTILSAPVKKVISQEVTMTRWVKNWQGYYLGLKVNLPNSKEARTSAINDAKTRIAQHIHDNRASFAGVSGASATEIAANLHFEYAGLQEKRGQHEGYLLFSVKKDG